jgi:hypothetical protein
MELDKIAQKYNTDKSSLWHNYTEKYDRYFAPLRDKKIKILEIGIQNGYSLKTWEEYFPNAQIFGIDIVDCKHMDTARIKTLLGSQNNIAFLKNINDTYGPFDIIIDDGSHNSADMTVSMNFLFPLLKSGGIYVVEDLHSVYWPELSDGGTMFMDRLKEMMDLANSNGKCGLAEIKNIDKDYAYQHKKLGEMNWWEKSIEYIHLYRSIVFIKKYASATTYNNPLATGLSTKTLIKRFLSKVRGRLTHMKNMSIIKIRSWKDSFFVKKKPILTPTEISEYRKKIKVYDVITYNGEADVLEMRLNILKDAVDEFIIVEAPTTFSGFKKPLYFQEQKDRFKIFSGKIKYFVINDYPNNADLVALANTNPNVPKDGPEHWKREFYQKESIKFALTDLHDDDFCFIGDADEIWNPEVVIDYSQDDIFKLRQIMYAYFLNNRSSMPWAGTIATKYKNIKDSGLNDLRSKNLTKYTYVDNAGWHFTNMGGVEEIRRKLNDSYTDESYNTREVQENLEKRFGEKDYIGRNLKFQVDETRLPKYLLENTQKYPGMWKQD